jgi:hypothetical protein
VRYEEAMKPLQDRVEEILFHPHDLTQGARNELQDLFTEIQQHHQTYHHVLKVLASHNIKQLVATNQALKEAGVSWLYRAPTVKEITKTDLENLF